MHKKGGRNATFNQYRIHEYPIWQHKRLLTNLVVVNSAFPYEPSLELSRMSVFKQMGLA